MRMKFLVMIMAAFFVVGCSTAQQGSATTSGAGGASQASGDGVSATGLDGWSDAAGKIGDVEATIYFGYDRYDLSAEARAVLDRQAAWLQGNPTVNIVVEGHCDERGTREYNLALGERRATSVKDYLVAAGVESSRVSTISYGKERPAVLGSNDEAWAANRRGVTVIQP